MLKLNASYSKKIPAGGNYSSQSYHVALEVELPDGLSENELKSKIAETFELARQSVEAELNPKPQPEQSTIPERKSQEEPPASDKQIAYLNTLIKNNGLRVDTLLYRYGYTALHQLTRKQCGELISELKTA